MIKNDKFFKLLFAIEVALIPMVFAAYIFMPLWATGLFIAGIFVCRVWMEVFKGKSNKSSTVINSIGSIAVFTALIVFYMNISLISRAIGIVAIICIILNNLFSIFLFGKNMPETIEAIDFCSMLFECLTLLAFIFASSYVLTTNVGMFAIILTAIVSILYKIYFVFRYTDFVYKLGRIFKRK